MANYGYPAPTKEEQDDAFRRLPPETQRAILNGTFQGTASVPYRNVPQRVSPKQKQSIGDIAKDQAISVGKDYAKNYLKEQLYGSGGAAATEYAGGAGLAGAGAVGESGASAGSVAAGQAAGGGTPYFDVGAPSYAGYLAAALDAKKGYDNLKRKNVSSDDKATRFQQDVGRAVGDVYTGGLAGIAEGYARGQWGGTMRKLDKLDQRTNPGTKILSKMMGGLSQGQVDRRNLRDVFRKGGYMDEEGNFTFDDGGTYGTERGTKDEWKLDPEAEGNGRAIGQMQPLAALLTGRGDGTELKDVATGYLTNAITQSGGDSTAKAREIYVKSGFKDAASAIAAIDSMVSGGLIPEDKAEAYRNGIRDVFGASGSSSSSSSSSGKGKGSSGKGKKGAGKADSQGNPLYTQLPSIDDWTTPNPNLASPVGGQPFTYADYANSYKRIAERNNPLTRRL